MQSSQGSQDDLHELQIFSKEESCSECVFSGKNETTETVFDFFYPFYIQAKMIFC